MAEVVHTTHRILQPVQFGWSANHSEDAALLWTCALEVEFLSQILTCTGRDVVSLFKSVKDRWRTLLRFGHAAAVKLQATTCC